MFGNFILEDGFYLFLEGSIVSFEHLEKSSLKKLDTTVDSSFEMEAVVLVVVELMLLVFYLFPFLLSMVGKALILSTSSEARMWRLTEF